MAKIFASAVIKLSKISSLSRNTLSELTAHISVVMELVLTIALTMPGNSRIYISRGVAADAKVTPFCFQGFQLNSLTARLLLSEISCYNCRRWYERCVLADYTTFSIRSTLHNTFIGTMCAHIRAVFQLVKMACLVASQCDGCTIAMHSLIVNSVKITRLRWKLVG